MKCVLTAFILLFSSCLLGGCRPPDASQTASSAPGAAQNDTQTGLLARVETEGDPALGPSPVVVYLLEDGEGVSGASVEITGDMTHAGMVPVIANATETEPGLYRAEDFEFTMAGDWILTAEVELPDGTRQQAETSVSVPGR